ncbi:hypothetical protein E3Q18_04420 [Wallemia mellicola]|nr:hypothetical protein E3Q18_04420 [Wallemia mellicola]
MLKSTALTLQRVKYTTTVAPLSDSAKRELITLFNQSQNFLNSAEIPNKIDSTLTNSNPGLPHHLTTVKFEKSDSSSNSKPLLRSSRLHFNEDIYRSGFDEFGDRIQWPSPGVHNLSDRERILRDTLFGTDSDGAPGLEIVEEAEGQLKNTK